MFKLQRILGRCLLAGTFVLAVVVLSGLLTPFASTAHAASLSAFVSSQSASVNGITGGT